MTIHLHETISIPNLCNRLRQLERFGLVEKQRANAPTGGYWYLWRLKQ